MTVMTSSADAAPWCLDVDAEFVRGLVVLIEVCRYDHQRLRLRRQRDLDDPAEVLLIRGRSRTRDRLVQPALHPRGEFVAPADGIDVVGLRGLAEGLR